MELYELQNTLTKHPFLWGIQQKWDYRKTKFIFVNLDEDSLTANENLFNNHLVELYINFVREDIYEVFQIEIHNECKNLAQAVLNNFTLHKLIKPFYLVLKEITENEIIFTIYLVPAHFMFNHKITEFAEKLI